MKTHEKLLIEKQRQVNILLTENIELHKELLAKKIENLALQIDFAKGKIQKKSDLPSLELALDELFNELNFRENIEPELLKGENFQFRYNAYKNNFEAMKIIK